MDRKEIAKTIRKELKENKITNKQVSVTSKSATYDNVIRVNIKDVNVSYKLVNEIANKYESVSYDQANGEILAGGNTYVHVEFNYDAIQEAKQNYMQKAEELMEKNKNCSANESVTVASKDNLTILYQPQWCNGSPSSIGLYRKPEGWEKENCYCLTNIKRYDAQCAESIAEALLMFACQYGIDVLGTKENEIYKDEDNSKNQATNEVITEVKKQTQEPINSQEESQETKQLIILDYVTIKADINTKTKEDIFVMKLKNKVEHETFKAFETEIKKIGGYYSRFKRGFIFKEDPTKKILTIDINILDASNIQQVEYPEININDIESYTVSKELSERENNNSMFRSHDINHTKELQKTLQSANNNVVELCNMPECTDYIKYKAKTYLQSFKKKYTQAYINTLTHKVNNPSWMITGRGNLNVSKYNKKQDQLTNKMKYQCQLIDDFNKKIQQYKNKIEFIQDKKEIDEYLQAIKDIDISKETFTHIKIKIHRNAITDIFNNASYEVNAYKYKNYYILKNYGSFRIYNNQGQEVEQKYRDGTLKSAKTYLLYYLSNSTITDNTKQAM